MSSRVRSRVYPWHVLALLVAVTGCGCGGAPRILSGYGSMVPVSGRGVRDVVHDGADVEAGDGEPVVASADGRVSLVSYDPEYGYEVALVHPLPVTRENRGAPRWTAYVHLKQVAVREGERVARGERLGVVGLFPFSGGVPHVPWQLCRTRHCVWGTTEDPMAITVGCYRAGATYPDTTLALTYPVRCR